MWIALHNREEGAYIVWTTLYTKEEEGKYVMWTTLYSREEEAYIMWTTATVVLSRQ